MSAIRFGRETKCGQYMTCNVEGRWYFCPTDPEWLVFNGNDEFSAHYETEEEAFKAAEDYASRPKELQ